MSFTLNSYSTMLKVGLESGYKFKSFGMARDASTDLICLLRHDVDADVSAALEMAKIEEALGVKSTYFFMTRSPIYNLMARGNHRAVKEILALGHWIGLHYDQGFDPMSGHTTEEWIEFEAAMIERMFGMKIEAVSFHQPGEAVLQGSVSTGKRINTYSKSHLPGFHYLSDSNRCWRNMHPTEEFARKHFSRIQLLIHPMWWVYGEEKTTYAVWDKAVESNFVQAQKQFMATEGAYGGARKIIIKIDERDNV
jgi:hypothetical protein